MRVENSIKSVAIGSFDGIHLAHQRLISKVDAVVVIEHRRGRLTHGFKRSWYAKKPLFFLMLHLIKSWSPEEFVAKLVEMFPNLEQIVVGYDFRFGEGRSGKIEDLQRLFSGSVEVVDEVKFNDISIHSRTIQESLNSGNLDLANGMLGRLFRVDGRVVKGQGLGKREFVPTINIKTKHYTLPKEGVYATYCQIGSRRFESVTFLGHRVTTDGSFALESHILGEDVSVEVDERIFVEFVARVRDNRKFESFEALKQEIDLDLKRAKEILGGV